jgi:glycine cleavage system H protein
MADIYFTEEHEWLKVEDGVATVGITDHAQEQLGDLVFVELPDVGRTLKQDEEGAVVESVKAASDVYAPASGEVVEINEAVSSEAELVNREAEGNGWLYKMKLSDPSELEGLMDREAYTNFIA